jgi:alkylhydroperoxidase/carboxymuconolactone decarboxylase family protein YurZ
MGSRISRSSESALRKLAIGDGPLLARAVCPESGPTLAAELGLDDRTVGLVRMAALIALDGESPSYLRECNAALASGATIDEIVGVLLAVASLTGSARIVSAAPRVALSVGYDVDAALESPDPPAADT